MKIFDSLRFEYTNYNSLLNFIWPQFFHIRQKSSSYLNSRSKENIKSIKSIMTLGQKMVRSIFITSFLRYWFFFTAMQCIIFSYFQYFVKWNKSELSERNILNRNEHECSSFLEWIKLMFDNDLTCTSAIRSQRREIDHVLDKVNDELLHEQKLIEEVKRTLANVSWISKKLGHISLCFLNFTRWIDRKNEFPRLSEVN